jgi:hypothetical protein
MSTKSRQVIWGGQIMGAKIRAQGARERAKQAIREADRAEAEAWSIRMEGYGGPAQPSPTIDAILRPRDTSIWKLEAALKCRSCSKGRCAPPVHMIKLTETPVLESHVVPIPKRSTSPRATSTLWWWIV